MKIFFFGDIYGRAGRDAVLTHLPELCAEYDPDAVIINGENAAHGNGITPKICDQLYDKGVDVITTGDHIWDQREIISYIHKEPRLLRPINLPEGAPGQGSYEWRTRNGEKVLVINAIGRTFMEAVECPFRTLDQFLQNKRLGSDYKAIFVDMHAETTSEKMAMGHFLDGRVSAVIGTHTHVPTADAHVLPGGTAYQTDAGMSGDYDSVIGRRKDISIFGFLRKMPGEKPQPASGEGTLSGAMVDIDPRTGLARSILSIKRGGVLCDHKLKQAVSE